ncbi:regulatory protein, FmdB family [Mycobacterium kansasii]|uniref:Regulatory protein, FmdB family n=1 Tax=Mycobacterium kansasii TaxID=1768 RepID=A0A1V3XCF7_MYCKA|nr:regulatory protein, FmdB family [Mycobacterium kansasii]
MQPNLAGNCDGADDLLQSGYDNAAAVYTLPPAIYSRRGAELRIPLRAGLSEICRAAPDGFSARQCRVSTVHLRGQKDSRCPDGRYRSHRRDATP